MFDVSNICNEHWLKISFKKQFSEQTLKRNGYLPTLAHNSFGYINTVASVACFFKLIWRLIWESIHGLIRKVDKFQCDLADDSFNVINVNVSFTNLHETIYLPQHHRIIECGLPQLNLVYFYCTGCMFDDFIWIHAVDGQYLRWK